MEIRPYDAKRDAGQLWECKRAFELGLGAGTGDDSKGKKYAAKVDEEYRERYLGWVDRCVADDQRCVTVADAGSASDEPDLAGYVFVLPERLSMIWDAAVLNELFVREEFRGTGVANDLMEAAIDLARDQDLPLDRLVLDVDRENERAKAFYDRHGFSHWGEMVARDL